MKLLSSLVLAAGLALTAHTHAQTSDQSSAKPPAATPPAASSPEDSASSGHECKKEVEKLCGRRAHGQEMQDCIKANLELKKFSAACQGELAKKSGP
jgi:hypothetical protein